jgi:hypothetical protein
MTGTAIIGPEGIYDPAMMNDRLLLEMKGSMSELELNLARQRSAEAIRRKALRASCNSACRWAMCGQDRKSLQPGDHDSQCFT